MALQVIPRIAGDDFQARWFWFQACRLFSIYKTVDTVIFESKEHGGFDDVVVKYSRPIPDGRGNTINADCYQIKFHVNHAGSFTCDKLKDPSFIGSSKDSILHRLRDAYLGTLGKEKCLFNIISSWPIDPNDSLATLVDQYDNKLRLDEVLFNPKKIHFVGIKDDWKRVLGVANEGDLYKILSQLRIDTWPPNLKLFQEVLNTKLENVGLLPISDASIGSLYDDLIWKLYRNGLNTFRQGDIIEIAKNEGLWVGNRISSETKLRLGIRSFHKWAEYLEDDTSSLLCLLKYFDNRKLKKEYAWTKHIIPEVKGFLESSLKDENSCELILDAHSSIAFLAGYILNSKSGKKVTIRQKTIKGGIEFWSGSEIENSDKSEWCCETIERDSGKADLAVAISISNNTIGDVDDFVGRSLPVGKILHLKLLSGTSQVAIKNGAHALHLAQDAIRLIREHYARKGDSTRVHFFISAPNGFTFFFGQASHVLGKLVLYEYDFSSGVLGSYEPAVVLP